MFIQIRDSSEVKTETPKEVPHPYFSSLMNIGGVRSNILSISNHQTSVPALMTFLYTFKASHGNLKFAEHDTLLYN